MRLRRPPIPRPKLQRARDLRRGLTMAERRAWNLLRNRRMLGLKFRRQHVIAGSIVNFCCAELRLVLEIDGSGHSGGAQSDYDAARTANLEAKRVPRRSNSQRCIARRRSEVHRNPIDTPACSTTRLASLRTGWSVNEPSGFSTILPSRR